MQIDEAKKMVQIASDFLKAQEPSIKDDIRVEQITERDGDYSIVLSFPDTTKNLNPTLNLLQMGATARVYKELVVDSTGEEVLSLKFWK